MSTFTQRNKTSKEFSGPEEASPLLRMRIIRIYEKYTKSVVMDAYNDDYINDSMFYDDLCIHFGVKPFYYDSLTDEDRFEYGDVFDFVELLYKRAVDELSHERRKGVLRDIQYAFELSGSVYTFSEDGHVILNSDDFFAELIDDVYETAILDDLDDLYKDNINGLINRTKHPQNIIVDMAQMLEGFLQEHYDIQDSGDVDKLRNYSVHPTHIKIIKKLYGFRGSTSAHFKKQRPGEADALWFVTAVLNEIRYLNSKRHEPNVQ